MSQLMRTRTSALLLLLLALVAATSLWQRHLGALDAITYQPSSDFYKFWLSADRFLNGKSMYWVIPPEIKLGAECKPAPSNDPLRLGGQLPCLAPNLNPPFFLALVAPLHSLPYAFAFLIWAWGGLACALVSTWIISQELKQKWLSPPMWGATLVTLVLIYPPLFIDFRLGQVGSILMLPLTLAWRDYRNGRRDLAAIWLGIAMGLKPLLLPFIPMLFLARQWRMAGVTVSVFSCTLLFGLLWAGHDSYQHYAVVAQHVKWTASNWNASVIGLIDRALGISLGSPMSIAAKALLLAMIAIFSAWVAHGSRVLHTDRQADIIFITTLPAILLAAPLGWIYYFPWLIICTAAWFTLGLRHLQTRTEQAGLLLCLALSCWPMAMKPATGVTPQPAWWGIDSVYFYALALAWLMCLLGCRRAVLPATPTINHGVQY